MDIIVACKRWGIAWAGVFLFWLAFIFAVGTVSICDAESWRPIDITLGAVFFLFVLAFSYSSWICLEISRKAGLDGLSDCWSAIILIPNAAFLPVVSLATTSFPLYRRPEGMTAGLAATFIAGLLWFFAGLLIAEFEAQFRRKPLVRLLRQTIFFYLMSISICLMVLLEYLIEGQFVYLFCYMGVLWAGWGVYWWSRDPVIAGGWRK